MIGVVFFTSLSLAEVGTSVTTTTQPKGVIPSGDARKAEEGAGLAPLSQAGSQLGSYPASPASVQISDKQLMKTLSGQPGEEASGVSGPKLPQPDQPKEAQTADQGKLDTVPVISTIEKALMESPTSLDKIESGSFKLEGLTQFGYSYFRTDVPVFDPVTDIPVGPDYVLGAGDRITLSVWGSFDAQLDLTVNRSGELILPKVGPVKVAGVPFGKLHSLISGSLARVYKDFQISVTMGKLRLMKVFVVGEVNSPGDYSLSSLSTVINALAAAKGPTKNGSLRSIQVKRDGKVVASADLYDFFTKGDKSSDIRLQPGDTIFVPTIGPVAGIAGNVRRPGIYELNNEKSLQELIALAGGVTSSGYLQRLQVSRIEAHDKRTVTDLNIDPKISGKSLDELAASLKLHDMDLVKIFPIDGMLRNYVRVEGHVNRPGDYALKPGMRVSQVLNDASLLPEYYHEAALIERTIPPDYHHEIFNFNVEKALSRDPVHDLLLTEFDRIEIFSRWAMEEIPKVKIVGEVQKPGEYRLYDNMTLRDLVLKAGNPKTTAYLKNAEILRLEKSGESVTARQIYVNLADALKGNAKDNIFLNPFDEVVVRKIPNWKEVADSYVTLKGEFLFPGVYPVYKGERLSSVIRRAGGFTDKAYLKGARFTREQIREIQQRRMDEILAREEATIATKQGELASVATSKEELEATKASLESLRNSIEILKKKRAEGRMVIKMLPEAEFVNSEYDFEVVAGDQLEVPSDPKVVSVFGQVYNPNSFLYVAGETVEKYIGKSGGLTKDAEEDDMYVVKADGTVVSRQTSDGFLFFGGFMGDMLDSGDTLVVPQRLERFALMRDIKDITTIISQIALTAGVFIAL